MAFFNNKVSTRRSQTTTPAQHAESVPVAYNATESLARASFARPATSNSNPFAQVRKPNPFAPTQAVAIQNDPGVIDMSGTRLLEETLLSLRTKLGDSENQVTKLVLREAEVTQQTASVLARTLEANNSIKELDISFNPIGSIGAAAIAEMIKFNTCLTLLDLRNNKINVMGGTMLGQALIVNRGLCRLRLGSNSLGDAGVAALVVGLSSNTSLHSLELENNDISDTGMESLGNALDWKHTKCQLRELYLQTNNITIKGVESLMTCLVGNSAITTINFTEKPVSVQELRNCGKEVNFSGSYLSPFNSVATMMLLASGNSPEESITSLKLNDVCLSGLDSAGRGMRTSQPCLLLGLRSQTPSFVRFKHLSLSGNDLSFSEVSSLLHGLATSSSLLTLDLSRNRLDTKASGKLLSMLGEGGLTNLDRLELGDNPALLSGPTSGASWGALLTSSTGPRKLRRLGIANTGLRGAMDLFQLIDVDPQSTGGWPIAWLDVRGNSGVNSTAKAVLAKAIEKVTTRMLHGGSKQYEEARWGLQCPWAGKNASGGVENSPFRFCGFSCDAFDIAPNSSTLSCQGSGLSTEDAQLIAALVRHHQHIKCLILDNNPAIGDVGCVALTRAVSASVSLERLSLRNCSIARSGATALVDLFTRKPGVVVRAAGGNINIPSGLRRSIEDQERHMQFELGVSEGSIGGSGGGAVPVLSMSSIMRPTGRDRMVDLKPMLAPGCCVASRVCRVHVLGDGSVGKRTLVSSLSRGWAASLMAAEDSEIPTIPLPVLSVAPPLVLGSGATTSTWIHGDIGNLKWLQQWPDAIFIVVVDLDSERSLQEKSIVHYLNRIHAAAPDNATIVLVGSKSDKLGKLGEEYLSRLTDSVSERLMSVTGAHGPPPPISNIVALDCRKSQSTGMKHLRSLLMEEQKRVIGRVPLPAASLSPAVSSLLTKWAQEAWLPEDESSITTPIVSVSELLNRCRLELFGGLKMSELLSILRTLQKSGAWMLLGNDNINIVEVDEKTLVNAFVVLNEDWLMRQLLSPASVISVDRMTLTHAHSTIATLAFGSGVTAEPYISQSLMSLLIAINYVVIVENMVIFMLGAKLEEQPPVKQSKEDVELTTLASRFMVESPSGGMELFTWRMLLAHVTNFLVPSFSELNDILSPIDSAFSSVELWANAVVFKGLAIGEAKGECMIQLVNNTSIDVMVQVESEDTEALLGLFVKVKDAVTEYLTQQKTILITLYDELKGTPDTWQCPPQNRVAVCSNRPPSPVFIRKQSSLEIVETEAIVEEKTDEEEAHMLASREDEDAVWYREDANVLVDLDSDQSIWGGHRCTLSANSRISKVSGQFEIMIPHPKAIKLSKHTNAETNTEISSVEKLVDVAVEAGQVAAAKCLSAVGSSTVVSCLSTWDCPVLNLCGMVVTYVSEVPFDKQAIGEAMDSSAVDTALTSLRYPLYLTLANKDECISEDITREFKLVLLSTTRQLVEQDDEWRLTGDAPPGPVSWRLVVIESKPETPVMGVDNTVTVEDFRVVATYPLTEQLVQQFISEHSLIEQSDIKSEKKVVVYVHGFLTPLCNALKSAAIFTRCFKKLVICFSWPCDPQLVSHSWLVTKVMSEFERNYTQAEQHMHGSISHLVGVARLMLSWGLSPVWRAHSMGNYLLLNAVDRLCWLSESADVNNKSLVGLVFKKLILDAPDVPTWFFSDIVSKAIISPHNCCVLHMFNPMDSAVEAGRQRRAIQGAYPGNALVVSSSRKEGGGEIQVVSCEGARATSASHDYGQVDGFCLRDQRDFLDEVRPHQRLLDAITEGSAEEAKSYPIYWKMRNG